MFHLLFLFNLLVFAAWTRAQNATITDPPTTSSDSPPGPTSSHDVTIFNTLNFTEYSEWFGSTYSGLSGTSSDFCVSRLLETLSSWNATAGIETYNEFGGSMGSTYNVGPSSFQFSSAEPPCCSTCSVSAGHAHVVYWPTPAPEGHPSTIVTNGQTYISPSVYIVYDNITATNLCGNVGSVLDKVTLTFDPTDVSSVRTVYNSRLNDAGPPIWPTTAVQMNFQDLNGCTINASDIDEVLNLGTKDLTATTISGTLYRWKPCLPFLDIPISQLDALQPEWSTCVRDEGSIIKGIWDPPIALTGKGDLQAPTTSAAPLPTLAPALKPTTSMAVVQSSKSNLAMDPPKPTPDAPTPAQPINQNPAPQPQIPADTKPNPAPPAQQNDPGVNPAPQPQDPAKPVPNSATPGNPQPGNPQPDNASTGKSQPGDPNIGTPNSNPQHPAVPQPPPSSIITVGSVPLALLPSGVIVAPNAGQTLRPGNAPLTVGGQVISVVDSSIIVVGSSSVTVAFPTPAASAPGSNDGIGGAIVSVWDGVNGGSSGSGAAAPTGTYSNGTGNGGPNVPIVPGKAATTQVAKRLGAMFVWAWGLYLAL